MNQKYRFLEQDENGKKCHRHQLLRNGEWIDMTGGSSVVDVLGKDGLTWWASAAAVRTFSGIEDCKVLTKIKNKKASVVEVEETTKVVSEWLAAHPNPTVEEWIKICSDAYKAHSVKLTDSAKEGTDMHALLEEYVKSCGVKSNNVPYLVETGSEEVIAFSKYAVENFKRFIWSEGHCFNEDLFVGGITDVGAELKNGTYAIVDFKSSKEAYFSQFVQIAIYNLLIKKSGLVDKDGNLIVGMDSKEFKKYIVIPFGAKEFTAVENNNVEGLMKAGLACIELYREKGIFENQ